MSASEARVHATLLAVVMWSVAAAVVLIGSDYRSFLGPLKGSDFIFFYTLGNVSEPGMLYDPDALYSLQVGLVPESAAERYLPVYPPHAAILFRPLAHLSYGVAALLWAGILVATYGACLFAAWWPFRHRLTDRRLVFMAAVSFPPLWFLVLHCQTTIVPLVGFTLAWIAMERQRRFLAGLALGLLILKPQFALVLVPLALACREWRMIGGASAAIALQTGVVIWVFGKGALVDYLDVVLHLPALNSLLEPKPWQMHSITVMTNQLPNFWGSAAWALLTVAIVIRMIQVWRLPVSLPAKMGLLVLASTLVNPHVFVYDVAVLAPALMWLSGTLAHDSSSARSIRTAFSLLLYWLFLSLVAPTAALIPFQLSVLLMGALFAAVSTWALAQAKGVPDPRPAHQTALLIAPST